MEPDPVTEHLPGNPFASGQHLPGNPFAQGTSHDIVLPPGEGNPDVAPTRPLAPMLAARDETMPGPNTNVGALFRQRSPEPVNPRPTSLAGRAAEGVGVATDLVNPFKLPQTLVDIAKGAGKSFAQSFSPVEGEGPSPGATRFGDEGAIAASRANRRVTKENTPSAITPSEHLRAVINTGANLTAPFWQGPLPVLRRVAANAALGALNDQGDPVRGGVAGGLVGEMFDKTGKLGERVAPEEAEGVSRGEKRAGEVLKGVGAAPTNFPVESESASQLATRRANSATTLGDLFHSELPNVLSEKIRQGSGFTLNPRTAEPVSNGYAVGFGNEAGRALVLPKDQVTPETIREYVARNADFFDQNPELVLGGWVDDKGKAYIEPSTLEPDLAVAAQLGLHRGEQAVGDLAKYAKGEDGTIPLHPQLLAAEAPKSVPIPAQIEQGAGLIFSGQAVNFDEWKGAMERSLGRPLSQDRARSLYDLSQLHAEELSQNASRSGPSEVQPAVSANGNAPSAGNGAPQRDALVSEGARQGQILDGAAPGVGAGSAPAAQGLLYHGTSLANVGPITERGLIPQVGDETRSIYERLGTPTEELRPAVYMGDREHLHAVQSATRTAVAHALGKDFKNVTPDDIRRYGAVAVISKPRFAFRLGEDQNVYDLSGNKDVSGEAPAAAEPNDVFSHFPQKVDRFVTGDELADLFRSTNQGLEYRGSGPFVTPDVTRGARDVINSALRSPFAAIREKYPELTIKAETALSSRANAAHIGSEQVRWLTEATSPEDQENFARVLELDKLRAISQSNPAAKGDPAVARNIAELESQVPQGFENSEAFNTLLSRYKSGILPQLEGAAKNAGVSLMKLPRANIRLVAEREDAPFAESVGGTGFQAGPSTGTASAANRARGNAGAYSTDLARIITADAMDKIPKAAKNALYQEVARIGTPVKSLASPVPEGMTRISFNDHADVIDDPAEAKITLDVPSEVADAVRHVQVEQNRMGPTSAAGRFGQKLGEFGSTAALAFNPAAAAAHSLTLGSTVGTVPEVGKPLRNLVGLVPGGSTASGLAQIFKLDRSAPEARALETRLSQIGALRPELQAEERSNLVQQFQKKAVEQLGPFGKVFDGENILFGPDGVDKRARLVLAERYIDAAKARGVPVTDAALRDFVVSRAGDYISGNAGELINALQRNKASLFARMASTRVMNSLRSATGDSGLPAATLGQKLSDRGATLARGLVGYTIGLNALNYLLSGHTAVQNQPGHAFDLQYGSDEKGAPEYVKGNILNTLVSTAARAGGESLARGDVRGAGRDATNTVFSTAFNHPVLRGAAELTRNRLYLNRQGEFERVGNPKLDPFEDLANRVAVAGRDMTGLGQLAGDETRNPTMNPVAAKTVGFFLPPLTSKGSTSLATMDDLKHRDVSEFVKTTETSLFRAAGDTAQQQQIIDDAVKQLTKAGYGAGYFKAQLTKTAMMANIETPEFRRAVQKAHYPQAR